MASIDVALDPGRDVTLFTVTGDLTAEEIAAAVSVEYARHPTTFVLWDLTSGSLNHVTAEGFRRVAGLVKNVRLRTPEAKTAYVASEDQEYGLMRMYVALAESAQVPVTHGVFRTREAAMAWLGEV